MPAPSPGLVAVIANVGAGSGSHNLVLVTPSGNFGGGTGSSVIWSFTGLTESIMLISDGTNWIQVGGSG